MTLPTGTISLSQVNVELNLSATATISLNDTAVRTLAGAPSGVIDMQDLQGKSNLFSFTISSNQIDANLRTLALAAGWNGVAPVQATINSGVWISGSVAANSTPAFTINGSWPNGVTLINNGTIAGRGGIGATSLTFSAVGPAGQAGGLALSVSSAVTIQNNGTIAGGGGGGGCSATFSGQGNCEMGESNCSWTRRGGGGGGGRSNASYTAAGGVLNGGTGTSSAAGAGGAGGTSTGICPSCNGQGGSGGAGGGWGSAGATAPDPSGFGSAGGAAGIAITGNSNITWTATGTRLGPIT